MHVQQQETLVSSVTCVEYEQKTQNKSKDDAENTTETDRNRRNNALN